MTRVLKKGIYWGWQEGDGFEFETVRKSLVLVCFVLIQD